MKYKVGYIGNFADIGEYILYNENISLELVICEESKLNDRLLTFCLFRNIKIEIINNKTELTKVISKNKNLLDFYIMCSFGIILPKDCTDIVNIYNIHYGDLPKYRGRHPLYWSTVKNEKYMGISIHVVNEKIDSGVIIWKELEPYYFWMNNKDIMKNLTNKVPILIGKLLDYIEGNLEGFNNELGNYYPIVNDEYKTINLELDSICDIFNKVRAQSGYQGAILRYNNCIYYIKKIEFSFSPSCDNKIVSIKYNEKIWINLIDYHFEGKLNI